MIYYFKSEESFNDVKFNELLFVLVIESIDISRCVINFVVVCICVVVVASSLIFLNIC
jgi:hypothetical protein